jgi:hypothetical protein
VIPSIEQNYDDDNPPPSPLDEDSDVLPAADDGETSLPDRLPLSSLTQPDPPSPRESSTIPSRSLSVLPAQLRQSRNESHRGVTGQQETLSPSLPLPRRSSRIASRSKSSSITHTFPTETPPISMNPRTSRHPESGSSQSQVDPQGATPSDRDVVRPSYESRSPVTESETESVEEHHVDVAQELAEQLIRFHGCSLADHLQKEEEHLQAVVQHTTLDTVCDQLVAVGIPNVLGNPQRGLHTVFNRTGTAVWGAAFTGIRLAETVEERMNEEHDTHPDREEEEEHDGEEYDGEEHDGEEGEDGDVEEEEGVDEEEGEGEVEAEENRSYVCLHASEHHDDVQVPEVLFDIDSIMGFASSLAVAKQGIKVNLAPHMIYNLSADIHLTLPVEIDGKERRVPLHEVPHYQFGRLVGKEDVTLYLFFPRLYSHDSRQNSYLKQTTLQRWTDQVLLRALYEQATGGTSQHYPASYAHGKLSSLAKYTESHSRLEGAARQQAISHYIPPQNVAQVWGLMGDFIREPGLQDFGDVCLFLTAKNLKVLTQRAILSDMWKEFFNQWELGVDSTYIHPDQVWIDLGKEVCAPDSFVGDQTKDDMIGETYLWRSCCLDSYWKWSLRGAPGHRSLRCDYQTALLRDAAGMTVLSPARSADRQQGLIYSQFYNSQKEVFDAAKTYPFHDASLETLALDPNLLKSWQHTGRSQNHRIDTLLASYVGSKMRSHTGMRDSLQKSFGIREEHRMTLTLARRIRHRLKALGKWNVRFDDTINARPYWRLWSEIYLEFIYLNMNKFAAGFEYVHSLTRRDCVSWEHTKMMIMFLRMIKFSYGSYCVCAESALWWDRREWPDGRVREGLGLSRTMQQYGYGWFLDKFDWQNFVFDVRVRDITLFGNIQMAEAYRVRWREVKEIKSDFLLIEQVFRLWPEHQGIPENLMTLGQYLIWICVRHFRKDVFGAIKTDIKDQYMSQALNGEIMLSQISMRRVLKKKSGCEDRWTNPSHLYIVTGNRMTFKRLSVLVNFLWDHNDGLHRNHWEHKGYRTLYQRCSDMMTELSGVKVTEIWQQTLKELFILTNWILPYPNQHGFMTRNSLGDRKWIRVYHSEIVKLNSEPPTRICYEEIYRFFRDPEWVIGRQDTRSMRSIPCDDLKVATLSLTELEEKLILSKEIYDRRKSQVQTRGELRRG